MDWENDVFPMFTRLDDLEVPWRWRESNPELGDWLLELRKNLQAGTQTDITAAPIEWRNSTHLSQQLAACKDLIDKPGSVVAIRKWAPGCHSVAQKLGGAYTSMEEMESRDLQKWAKALEKAKGVDRSLALLRFAAECMTAVNSDYGSMAKTLKSGKKPKTPKSPPKRVAVEHLVGVTATNDLLAIAPAMSAIERASTGNMFRRELWDEMAQAVTVHSSETHASLAEAAWVVRDRGRHAGRKVAPKVISRTLLVKGLEFDHSIVLDASELDTKNLYVAMTRGSSTLTVLSESSLL